MATREFIPSIPQRFAGIFLTDAGYACENPPQNGGRRVGRLEYPTQHVFPNIPMSYADLHLHSNHSDGSDAPACVVQRAVAAGMVAMALTDHDTLSGVPEARAEALLQGITLLSGVEISARFERREVHVMGLGIREDCPPLLDRLAALQLARRDRVVRMVDQLRTAGIPLDADRIRARTAGIAPGRMHVAVELRDQGTTRSTQEGFDRFLNFGCPGYVPKEMMSVEEAIDLVHAADGLAFVGHPGLSKSLRQMLPKLLTLPFDGLEAYHISHSPGRTDEFLQTARGRGLLISGGSDCHGTAKTTPEMGKVRMPSTHFEAIQAALHATS